MLLYVVFPMVMGHTPELIPGPLNPSSPDASRRGLKSKSPSPGCPSPDQEGVCLLRQGILGSGMAKRHQQASTHLPINVFRVRSV